MTNAFSRKETVRFDNAIKHINESLADGTHDFRSAMHCSGITFSDDVDRFHEYCKFLPDALAEMWLYLKKENLL